MSSVTVDSQVTEQWDSVLASLRDEIGEAAFQSWLKPMTVREVIDGNIRISVPTRFMKDWVSAHYADRLVELWETISTDIREVEIFVQADYGQKKTTSPVTASAQTPAPEQAKASTHSAPNLSLVTSTPASNASSNRPNLAPPHLAAPALVGTGPLDISAQIGRASCRERV